MQASTAGGIVELHCRLDEGVQECLLPIQSALAPGTRRTLHLLVTVAASAQLSRLGIAAAMTSGPDLLGLTSRTIPVTAPAPAPARVMPVGTTLGGGTGAAAVGGGTGAVAVGGSTPMLAQTGAPTLPWTIAVGLALVVLGGLLHLLGRRQVPAGRG